MIVKFAINKCAKMLVIRRFENMKYIKGKSSLHFSLLQISWAKIFKAIAFCSINSLSKQTIEMHRLIPVLMVEEW